MKTCCQRYECFTAHNAKGKLVISIKSALIGIIGD